VLNALRPFTGSSIVIYGAARGLSRDGARLTPRLAGWTGSRRLALGRELGATETIDVSRA